MAEKTAEELAAEKAAAEAAAKKEPIKGDELHIILVDPTTMQHDASTGIVWSTIQVHKTKLTPFVASRLGKTLREATKEEITKYAAIVEAEKKAAAAKAAKTQKPAGA